MCNVEYAHCVYYCRLYEFIYEAMSVFFGVFICSQVSYYYNLARVQESMGLMDRAEHTLTRLSMQYPAYVDGVILFL